MKKSIFLSCFCFVFTSICAKEKTLVRAYTQQTEVIAESNNLTAEEYFTKGNNVFYSGFYELAIEYFQKAIEIDPTHAKAYYNMGVAYSDKGNYDQAIVCYQKSSRL